MDSAVIAKWVIAVPLLGFGAWIVFFNFYRYRLIREYKVAGIKQRVSSVGFMGPLLLLLGLAAAPIEWSYWFFAVVLLEVGAIDFVEADSTDDNTAAESDTSIP